MNPFTILAPRWLPDTTGAVVVRISPMIEAHHEARGAIPLLRTYVAPWIDTVGWPVHYLTVWQAADLMADAYRQVAKHDRSLTIAYRALIAGIEDALTEAATRPALFEAAGPTLLSAATAYAEDWRGTRQQWRAVGLRVPGPWPGERGAPKLAKGQDDRGARASVTQHHPIWPGLFNVRIGKPPERAALSAAVQRAHADRAFQRAMGGLIASAAPLRGPEPPARC